MMPIVATGGGPGGYFSLARITVMLALFVPWLYAAPWVNKDSERLRFGRTRWGIIMLSSAALRWLLWFTIPIFLVGLLLYLLFAGGPLATYVVLRNKRVPESAKVLTGRHLSSVFGRGKEPMVEVVTKVKFYGAHGRIILAPNAKEVSVGEVTCYNRVQELLHDIVWRRASEADLSPTGQNARLRLVIDGVAADRSRMSIADSEAVIQYLKLHGGMNVEDHRRPQQGRVAVDHGGERVDVDLTCAGSTHGQRMQFRIVQEAVRTKLDELGMADDQLAKLREFKDGPNGLTLVSGKSGSGVTSTLYSLLREHDPFMKVLVTLELRPKVDLENVTQNAYGDPAKLQGMLATALRRDPDVIMVDASADSRTAAIVVEAAAAKHVILGIRASDSFMALAKWIKVSERPAEALENLRCILYQSLLRKLCPACKEAYRPDPKLLAKANLQSEGIDRFYRPRSRPITDEKGNPITCQTCQGMRYVGRTGVFEMLEITDGLRKLVLSGAPLADIKAECRKRKMLYLQERALQKVIAGETSVQEVIRITQQAKKQ